MDKVSFRNLGEVALRLTTFRRFRVFVDDVTIALDAGGKAYSTYGIDRRAGATVVVRPDGYVGLVAPLEDVGALNTYFASFMTQRTTSSTHQ